MKDWVSRVDQVWTFQVPVAEVRKRGLINLFFIPVLCGLLALLLTLMFGPGSEWVVVPLCGLGALAGMAQGLLFLVTADKRSQDSRVVYDLQANNLDGRRLAPVQKIEVLQPSTWLKFLEIRLVTSEGHHALVERIAPKQGKEALAIAQDLGRELGVPVEDVGGVTDTGVLGLNTNHAGAACYFPVQGIFLIASVALLIISRKPAIRFHAIQSLTVFALFLFAILLVVGVGAGAMAVDEGAGVVVLVLGLLGVALPRLVLRFVLCWKAWKGQLWIVPGLGFWMRRWLP